MHCLLSKLLCLSGMALVASQNPVVVTETVQGSIFRHPLHVSVDQYRLDIREDNTIVEVDVLSMETADNVSFVDVNNDCDSAFIDPQLHLFRIDSGVSWQHLATVDDEGDDFTVYFGRGRRDGSVSSQDSYMIQRLSAGSYILAVGRFPLSKEAAERGKDNTNVRSYSPYACQMRNAPYGNYQLTIRSQSTLSTGVVATYPDSYVGNSCFAAPEGAEECLFAMAPGSLPQAISSKCPYDRTL